MSKHDNNKTHQTSTDSARDVFVYAFGEAQVQRREQEHGKTVSAGQNSKKAEPKLMPINPADISGVVDATISLNDYDWVEYIFTATIPTRNQGRLDVEARYRGGITSEASITQFVDGGCKIAHYSLQNPSQAVLEAFKGYLEEHLAQWNEASAFNSAKPAIKIFNTLLNSATSFHVVK